MHGHVYIRTNLHTAATINIYKTDSSSACTEVELEVCGVEIVNPKIAVLRTREAHVRLADETESGRREATVRN